MVTGILRCFFLALLVAFAGSHTFAAPRNLGVSKAKIPPNEQRVALVIGNSAYKEAPLRNPANDATDMAATLRGLGFSVTLKTNADTRQMRAAIREFAQSLKRGGVGLFYFAGHGVQSRNGRNFLIPVGAYLKDEFELEDEAVDANRVLAGMEEAGNRVNIVILDACRNNPFSRSWRSASNGLAQMSAPAGSFVGFATAPGQVAADGSGRNGLYTKHLLESLKAGDPDIDRVFTRVTAAVAKETGNKQVPWKSSSLTGDFHFRQTADGAQPVSAAPSADPTASDRALWDAVKDSKNPEELGTYLNKFPDGLFAELAQTRLDALESAQVAAAVPSASASRPAAAQGSNAPMSSGSGFRDCDACPEMVVIPAGSFVMGSPASEAERFADEGPQREVTIPRAFSIGKYEVTFDEWDACLRDGGCGIGAADLGWGRGRRPVINVSWNNAKQYAAWLARKTGKNYRLLSEAEWEYAARAGTTTPFHTGATIDPTQANYFSKVSYAGSPTAADQGKTVPVGSYAPNAFGLYDMHGNVWEWTEDCWHGSFSGAPSDGGAWIAGSCGERVLRGGSWFDVPRIVRSARRSRSDAGNRFGYSGFRVALTN